MLRRRRRSEKSPERPQALARELAQQNAGETAHRRQPQAEMADGATSPAHTLLPSRFKERLERSGKVDEGSRGRQPRMIAPKLFEPARCEVDQDDIRAVVTDMHNDIRRNGTLEIAIADPREA